MPNLKIVSHDKIDVKWTQLEHMESWPLHGIMGIAPCGQQIETWRYGQVLEAPAKPSKTRSASKK
jgi:hypothetical protein